MVNRLLYVCEYHLKQRRRLNKNIDLPFIILEDADIDKAVEWAVVGRINNNGQCCVASKRFIAVESIA